MRRANYLFSILVLALTCSVAQVSAQSSSLTATITDTDSQTWNSGTWTATLINPTPQIPPSINGTPLTNAQQHLSGTMSSSGVITGTFSDNNFIVPAGTSWQFTICPNASATCSVGSSTVTGASPNLSTVLSSFTTAPRFPANSSAFGYRDGEVAPTPRPGGTYFNVVTPVWRQWNGSAWTNVSSGGGGGGAGVGSITIAPSDCAASGTASLCTSAAVTLTGTNDQTTINTAIHTYCPVSNVPGTIPGCTLNFLYGHIHLTGSIVRDRSDMTLQCQGFTTYGNVGAISNGGCQFVADNSAGAFPLFTTTTVAGCLGPGGAGDNRCRGQVLQNLYIVCNDTTQTGILDSTTADNAKMENNTIQNCGAPISVAEDSPDIGGNNIQYNSAGVQATGVHSNIHNNLIFDNNVSPTGWDIFCGTGCIATGNTLGNSGGAGAIGEILVGGDSVISGNTIINTFGVALAANTNSYNVAITGNTITQANVSAHNWIELAGCSGCTVTDNSGVLTDGGATQTGFFIDLQPGVVNGVVNSVISNNAVSGPFSDPSDIFTNGLYNFGTPDQNLGNTISNNIGGDSMSVPTSLGSTLFVPRSRVESLFANCYYSGASHPCGFSWQILPGAAGLNQAQLAFTTNAALGSIEFDTPNGILAGGPGHQMELGNAGGNGYLGQSSAIWGDVSKSQGIGFFSANTASAYSIYNFDFGAGAGGGLDHSTIHIPGGQQGTFEFGTLGGKNGTINTETVNINGGATTVYKCSGGTFDGMLATASGACTGGSGTATHLHID